MRRSSKGYRKPKPGEYILRDGWYWPDAPCRQGHNAPRNHYKQCVECIRVYRASKGYFLDTPNAIKWRMENKAAMTRRRGDYAKRNPKFRMLANARRAAKMFDVPFDLTEDDIELPTHCPALGVRLHYGMGKRRKDTASLDRIVPSDGYVRGNVMVVSWHANRIKSDATIEELEKVATHYKKLRQKSMDLS